MDREARFEARCQVGRLIEASFEVLDSAEHVRDFQRAMGAAFDRAGPRAVICADWRAVEVVAPAVGEALVELLRKGNQRFERSAILLARDGATLGLQVERLLREASNSSRRSFRDPGQQLAWLGKVLTHQELIAAKMFLALR